MELPNISTLDLSQNTNLTHLYCSENQITYLDLSNNTALTTLYCEYNQLTSLDVSNSIYLEAFTCVNNLLTSLDVSANTALKWLACRNNQLTSLDVRNGNNTNLLLFDGTSNPNLTCIDVDEVNYSTTYWTDIDPQHYFSTNCPPPSAIQEHTTNKELLKATDLLGRETKGTKNELLFYIYNDGTVEKKMIIE
ncbi:MAG: leucine-rich repeat domain-containing protein [Flavobacteriales bacterium]